VFTVDLHEGLSIAFPAVARLPDAILMQTFVNIAVPYDGSQFGKPWTVYLTQENWRKSETGDIMLRPMPEWPPEINPEAFNPRVPLNSALPGTSQKSQTIRTSPEFSNLGGTTVGL
jgi:hypothetical protein